MLPSAQRAATGLCLIVVGAVAAVASASPTTTGEAARDGLLAREAALASRAGAVLAELTALEGRIAAARAERDALRTRAAAHARRGEAVAARLRLARHNHGVARRTLAHRLRALYVARSPQPVELLLGARSLDDAVTALDGLALTAEQDRELVAAATSTGARLLALRRRLAREAATIRRLEAAAAARAAALERAGAERRALLAGIRAEQQLTARTLAALERHARAAARPSQASVPSRSPSPVPARHSEAVTAPAGARTVTVVASGYALRGPTATGVAAGPGIVAVDPAVIPLGTRMTVPGYGEGVAADVGSAVRGAAVDLWFPSVAQALAWGRRVVTISLHGTGE